MSPGIPQGGVRGLSNDWCINSMADLDKVKSFSTGNSWMFPASPDPLALGGRGRGVRSREGRGGTRVGLTRSST